LAYQHSQVRLPWGFEAVSNPIKFDDISLTETVLQKLLKSIRLMASGNEQLLTGERQAVYAGKVPLGTVSHFILFNQPLIDSSKSTSIPSFLQQRVVHVICLSVFYVELVEQLGL
jgi:hypothetical protein